MAKIVLNPVTNGNTLSVINANFDKIEAELQNKVLYRDNPPGETNTVRNDLDLDGNDIFNVGTLEIDDLVINGVLIPGEDLAAIPGMQQDIADLQTGLGNTNAELDALTSTVNTNAAIEDAHHRASVRTSGQPIDPIQGDRPNKFLVFDVNGNPSTSFGTGADIGLRTDLATVNGVSMLGYSPTDAQKVFDYGFTLPSYTELRAYTSRALSVTITNDGIYGEFKRDLVDVSTPDNGGTVIVDALGRRWKRQMDGLFASPYWFELPLVSSGVDNTIKLQAILDCPRFAFPKGFQSHTSRLHLKSNCIGHFGDAKFTLLNTQPSGTQIIMLGKNFLAADIPTYVPERCVNSVFYGGVFDGNKANNTATSNAGGAAGGDGGMHGLHIHDATNVHWYGPKFQNCGTDGIIVWQRRTGTVASLIKDVHIHGPISDLNGRQGVSIISADDVHFYDSVFSNTGIGATGKAPRAGIDLEGNASTDFISSYFHGTTECFGNLGRGFQTTTPGSFCGAYFGKLLIHDNLGSDAQFSVFGSGGDAVNDIVADAIEVYNGQGVLVSQSGTVTANAVNKIRCGTILSRTKVDFNNVAQLDIDLLDVTSASTAFASLNIYAGVGGLIRRVKAVNTGVTNSHFPVYMQGTTPLRIGTMTTDGVRGITLSPASNKTIDSLTVSGALGGSAVNVAGASEDNVINILFLGTLSADYPIVFSGSAARNDISLSWPGSTRSMINLAAASDGNRFKINQGGSYTGVVLNSSASATNNLIYSSVFKTTTGVVGGTVAGCKVLGSVPFSVNSTS